MVSSVALAKDGSLVNSSELRMAGQSFQYVGRRLPSYNGLNSDYVHQAIDHAREYVRGNVHTNGLENFWCLLKRGIRGTYVSVEPFHLFRYLDEQAFRFNEREMTDSERFLKAAPSIVGRRLTYKGLTGNVGLG
jgi:hypothetical protein